MKLSLKKRILGAVVWPLIFFIGCGGKKPQRIDLCAFKSQEKPLTNSEADTKVIISSEVGADLGSLPTNVVLRRSTSMGTIASQELESLSFSAQVSGPGIIDGCNFTTLHDAISGGGTGPMTLVIGCPLAATLDETVPPNISVSFIGTGKLNLGAGITVKILGALETAEKQIFEGSGLISLPNVGTVWARWFGASGDGEVDDAPAINRAILTAQASGNATLNLGVGIFAISSTLIIHGQNKGINLTGVPGTLQQGSAPNSTQLRWIGPKATMLFNSITFGEISWITFDNFNGNALSAISYLSSAGRATLDHLTFYSTSNQPWGTAAVHIPSGTNYTTWKHIEGLAGPFLNLTGGTDLLIESSVFEDVTASERPWFLIGKVERFIFSHVTWNIRRADAVVLRTRPEETVFNLTIEFSEYDDSTKHPPNATWLDLNNVASTSISGTDIYGAGQGGSLISLTSSRLSLKNNTLSSFTYLVSTNDCFSAVFAEENSVPGNNVLGILSPDARSGNIVSLTPAGEVAVLHGEGISPSAHAVFQVYVVDDQDFSVRLARSSDTDTGFITQGQVFTVTIRNSTDGGMGDVTFPSDTFKTSGSFSSPGNGKNRSITFVYDGAFATEISRTWDDVEN